MAEFIANLQQEVQPNAAIVFTDTIVPCNRGLIEHRNDTGSGGKFLQRVASYPYSIIDELLPDGFCH